MNLSESLCSMNLSESPELNALPSCVLVWTWPNTLHNPELMVGLHGLSKASHLPCFVAWLESLTA